MRIMYDHQVFSNNGKSGISRYFIELAARLCRFPDVKLEIVAPFSRSPFLSEQRSHLPTVGIDLVRLPMTTRFPDGPMRLLNHCAFRAYAKFAHPDIVHETYYSTARTAPEKSKIVVTVHDTIPERIQGSDSKMIKYRLRRQKIFNRADWLICVSESTKNDLLELYDVDPMRVSVSLLASSLSRPQEGPIDIKGPYFLHVGNRYPHKNFKRVMRAFGGARLYRTHKLVSFSGSQWSEDELEEMRRAGIPESAMVSLGGSDAVLARCYAGADALVFPSLYEGFGIPLVEAMELGCPIVTSNVSSLPEVAGDAAIYVDPRDSGAIADALVKLASSPETRGRLIANGRVQAQRFSWDQCASATYAAYCNLVI